MRKALAAVLAVVAVAVSAAGCGSHVQVEQVIPVIPTTLAPTTSAPTTATTVVQEAVSPLSQPVAPPSEDYYDEALVTIGHLVIPRLGLDTDVHQGLSLRTIDHGPSHWPGTALPGHLGNLTLAGHRVTHSRPFRHLDELQLGDTATFTTDEGAFTYEFVGRQIVTPDRVDIATQWVAYTATMFACHPPGSARQRIVAYWRLVSAPAAGQPDPGAYPPIEWPPPPPPDR